MLGSVYTAANGLFCCVSRALREAQDIFGLDFDPAELDRMMEESYLSSDEEEEEEEEEVRWGREGEVL